jgi:hypothetical protein
VNDDVHNRSLGKSCDECHSDSGWASSVRFDHDMTSFPLNGLHASAPCEECHDSPSYTDIKSSCVSCHNSDDKHKEGLGRQCQQCHNPNSWGLWRFDHNRQTNFRLSGAHEGLICTSCHTTPMASDSSLSSTCQSCHRQDDIHDGDFGQSCERCHTTNNFKDLELAR